MDLFRLILVATFAASLCAQEAKITGKLRPGDKTVEGTLGPSTIADGTVAVRLTIDGNIAQPKSQTITHGKTYSFKLALKDGLKSGTKVQVQRTKDGTPVGKPAAQTVNALTGLRILSSHGVYGSKDVVVRFDPIQSSAVIEVKTNEGSILKRLDFSKAADKKELAAGKTKVTLDWPVARTLQIQEITVKSGGAAATCADCFIRRTAKMELFAVKERENTVEGRVYEDGVANIEIRVHYSALPRDLDPAKPGYIERDSVRTAKLQRNQAQARAKQAPADLQAAEARFIAAQAALQSARSRIIAAKAESDLRAAEETRGQERLQASQQRFKTLKDPSEAEKREASRLLAADKSQAADARLAADQALSRLRNAQAESEQAEREERAAAAALSAQQSLAQNAKSDELRSAVRYRKSVENFRVALVDQLERAVMNPITSAIKKDKSFTVTLPRNLAAGEYVSVRPVYGGVPADVASDRRRADSTVLNWGRVRGVFYSGAAISSGNGESQTDPYLSFRADARLMGMILDKCDEEKARKRAANGNSECDLEVSLADPTGFRFRRDFRAEWHMYSDTRLTQIDKTESTSEAAMQPAGMMAAALTEASGGVAQTAPETNQTPAPQTTTTAVRSSQVQFGAYGAFSFKGWDWNHKGKHYAFHIGPLLKAGFQTVDGGVNLSRDLISVTLDGMPVPDDQLPTSTPENRDGALPFWGYGGRLGFTTYDFIGTGRRNRQVSTDWVGYVDFTWGKNHAFRTQLPALGATVTEEMVPDPDDSTITRLRRTSTQHVPSRLGTRLQIEARLKLPYLPAFIGVDANLSQADLSAQPNDIRFLTGLRFDANKSLGRLFGVKP